MALSSRSEYDIDKDPESKAELHKLCNPTISDWRTWSKFKEQRDLKTENTFMIQEKLSSSISISFKTSTDTSTDIDRMLSFNRFIRFNA